MLDIETWGMVPATLITTGLATLFCENVPAFQYRWVPATLITTGLATYIVQSYCTMPTYAEYGLILISAGIILSSVGLINYKLKTRQP